VTEKTDNFDILKAVASATGLFVLIAVFAFWQPTDAQVAAVKPSPDQALYQLGRDLYQKQCLTCHGLRGEGDGPASYLLYPKPRNFSRNEFRLVSTTDMTATDEDLFKTITRGMPGSSMPAWEHLDEKDRWALVYYVRYLAELRDYLRGGEVTEEMLKTGVPWPVVDKMIRKEIDPLALIAVPAEAPVHETGLAQGREFFVKACAPCHGLEGKGDGQQRMIDSQGVPVKPRDLTAGIFKADSSSRELYHRILAGLPGSPMPGYQGVFTDQQIWDLIHYVQTLPAKGSEGRAQLRRMTIRARKVRGTVETDPLSAAWLKLAPVQVTLTPLWWRNDRVESVEVRAVYDKESVAIHLVWADETQNNSTLSPQGFSDGAALQFSAEKDPPLFAMGSAAQDVLFWHWKASWQEDAGGWKDVDSKYPNIGIDYYPEKTDYPHGAAFDAGESVTAAHDPERMTGWGAGNPVSDPFRGTAEEGRARGVGTFTTMRPETEKVEVRGAWKDGKWHVLFRRQLRPQDAERISFERKRPVPLAFAVWDGEKNDRNGQKMISIWNELVLD
jgi:mono/diheme cytochrome c family protein